MSISIFLVVLLTLAANTVAGKFDPIFPTACVAGPHSGILTVSQQWCASDSPHLISADVTVPAGITLTIEPATTIQGAGYTELLVQGQLIALGTPMQPILFTSQTDTGPGQWSGVGIEGGTAHFQYTTIRYAGHRLSLNDNLFGDPYHRSAITVSDGVLELENVTLSDVVTDSYDHGLIIADSQVTIDDSLFTDTGGGGGNEDRDIAIMVTGPDTTLEMHGNTFIGNLRDRALLMPGAMTNHDITLYAQPVMDGYEYQGTYTIPSGIAMTMEPGTTLKSGLGAWGVPYEFRIEGHLEAVGTASQPIVFTSAADSEPEQWPGLVFDGGSGHLRYATLRNAGMRNSVMDEAIGSWARSGIAARDVQSGELHLEHCTVRDIVTSSQEMGIYAENSNLIVADSLFTGIGDGSYYVFPDNAIYIAGSGSNVTLNENAFTGNNSNTVVLQPGAMMSHDTTLTKQIDLDGYVLEDDFTVPLTTTLTVEPGVTVMGGVSNARAELRIDGHLAAVGTPDEPIVFTSFEDSGPNQWAGLVFDGNAGLGTGRIAYAIVRYGGRGNSVLNKPVTGYHSGSNITINGVQNGQVKLEHVLVTTEYHFDGWHKFWDHGIYIDDSYVALLSSTIEENSDNTGDGDSGIYVAGTSRVTIEDTSIQSNSGHGILIDEDDAVLVVHNSLIANNIGDGVRNTGAADVVLSGTPTGSNTIQANQEYGVNQSGTAGQTIATYNWWGDVSGPTHASNPGGIGEPVTDRVLYDPWLAQSPPPPTDSGHMVQVAAPPEVSVGQTVNLGVFFQNLEEVTLQDAIVVLEIPWRAEYQFSTQGGQFWPLHNHVIWKLGDVAPGESFEAIAQVWYRWGTPNGTIMPAIATVAAENLMNDWLTYEAHLAYEELAVIDEQTLSQLEVDAILAGDSELDALFDHALAQGFTYYGEATLQTLNDGTTWFEMLLLDLDRPGEVLAVRRIGEDRHIRHESEQQVAIYDLTGGATFDYVSAEWLFSGNLAPDSHAATCVEPVTIAFETYILGDLLQKGVTGTEECPQHNWGDCLRNCLIQQVPREMANPSLFAGSSACQACVDCDEFCLDICSDCARDLWQDHQHEHYRNCTETCADSSNWNNYRCDDTLQSCYDAPRNESATGRSQYRMTYACDDSNCKYLPDPTLEYCPNGCIEGDTLGGIVAHCKDCTDVATRILDVDCIYALTAHDPNAFYGPDVATPGQTIVYTAEWENEGAGTAYGVYVESTIPAELDDSTLVIGNSGVYDPSTRTILWEIGELAAGAGASATYSAQLPTSVVSGTVLLAEATVYFPSVPEVTPTNPAVTLVQDVVAYNQQVQTDENTPIDVLLTGYAPGNPPLDYTIITYPRNGALTGTAPYITYEPAQDFEGLDWLAFAVEADGASYPAIVTIFVETATENTAPRVLVTAPRNGAEGVMVYSEPLYDGIYAPAIWALFNEPLNVSTLSASSFFMIDSSGQTVDCLVAYDGTYNKALLMLQTPLQRGQTYTVTLTKDVKDSSGNRLTAPFSWQFSMERSNVFVPVILGGG
ncbi:MAG: Ig-like domain-containing protein [Anaerolineae bacterium]|nr:Ig-like domain-containing protein [Anaerolineae bacterium]